MLFIWLAIIPAVTPRTNTTATGKILDAFEKFYADDKIVLVMDGAGWHKSKTLQVPDNIEIILLPPYSPELNPVERFWQYIKQNTIKNKVYKTLNGLKDAVAKFLNSMTPDKIMSICAVYYL